MSTAGRKGKTGTVKKKAPRREFVQEDMTSAVQEAEEPPVIEGYSVDYRDSAPKKGGRISQKSEPRRPKTSAAGQPGEDTAVSAAADLTRRGEREEPLYELPMDKDLPEDGIPADDSDVSEDEDLEFVREKAAQVKSMLFESKPPKKRGRRKYGIAVGSIVLLLALVGVGFLATAVGQAIHRRATDDGTLREYDKLIAPVVMQDPVPFETVDGAEPEMVMTASLWRAITDTGAQNFTTYDESGRSLVPLGLVENACHTLFGPDCTLQPKSPARESYFEFNSSDNQFHISPYSDQSSYAPYTESAKNAGDSVILRVGYVSAVDEYRISSGVSKPSPAKYMEYVLKTNPQTGKKYVAAVRTAS